MSQHRRVSLRWVVAVAVVAVVVAGAAMVLHWRGATLSPQVALASPTPVVSPPGGPGPKVTIAVYSDFL